MKRQIRECGGVHVDLSAFIMIYEHLVFEIESKNKMAELFLSVSMELG